MDLFGKKYFENQDFLTQSVEPYECEVNAILSSLPDSVDITIDMLTIGNYGVDIDRGVILSQVVQHADDTIDKEIYERHSYKLSSLFKIETSPNTIINFKDRTITGTLQLVKKQKQLDDAEVLDLMASAIRGCMPGWNINRHRTHEILDLMDLDVTELRRIRRLRSERRMAEALKRAVRGKIIKTKEWNIRSVEFTRQVCGMIRDYVEHGNEEALKNFILFKMMTHSGHPIYAME